MVTELWGLVIWLYEQSFLMVHKLTSQPDALFGVSVILLLFGISAEVKSTQKQVKALKDELKDIVRTEGQIKDILGRIRDDVNGIDACINEIQFDINIIQNEIQNLSP